MKPLSETIALEKLHGLKTDFAARIRSGYEHRAKSCATCETPGACCLDAHFVNVHITKLEAKAIRNVIDELPEAHQAQIDARIVTTIARYELTSDGDTFSKCLDSGAMASVIKSSIDEAQAFGLPGTPGFVVNGRFISGAVDYERLRGVIEEELGANAAGSNHQGVSISQR